jgi:hypothetical protein
MQAYILLVNWLPLSKVIAFRIPCLLISTCTSAQATLLELISDIPSSIIPLVNQSIITMIFIQPSLSGRSVMKSIETSCQE